MPYLTQVDRALIDAGFPPETAGELNYALTKVVLAYTERMLLSYATINDVMGALTSAQAEYYRRVAAPYENEKCRINGEVYL